MNQENTKPMFVVAVEIDLTQEEFDNFAKLSKDMEMSLPDCVRMCMNDKCEELLDKFENNVPDKE